MKAVLQYINNRLRCLSRSQILTSVLPWYLYETHKHWLFAVEHRPLWWGQSAIDPPGFSHLLRFPQVFSLMSYRPACVLEQRMKTYCFGNKVCVCGGVSLTASVEKLISECILNQISQECFVSPLFDFNPMLNVVSFRILRVFNIFQFAQ